MRSALLLFATLSLAFAPAPFPRPQKLESITLPLKQFKAIELAVHVKKMLTPRGKVAVNEKTNELVITDQADKLARIVKFLRSFDTVWWR